MTRCVRGALLLGEESFDRRLWIERRIEKLAEIFTVSVGGFAVMDSHFHVLVRLDADVACD
jgi:putative transposase